MEKQQLETTLETLRHGHELINIASELEIRTPKKTQCNDSRFNQ